MKMASAERAGGRWRRLAAGSLLQQVHLFIFVFFSRYLFILFLINFADDTSHLGIA